MRACVARTPNTRGFVCVHALVFMYIFRPFQVTLAKPPTDPRTRFDPSLLRPRSVSRQCFSATCTSTTPSPWPGRTCPVHGQATRRRQDSATASRRQGGCFTCMAASVSSSVLAHDGFAYMRSRALNHTVRTRTDFGDFRQIALPNRAGWRGSRERKSLV